MPGIGLVRVEPLRGPDKWGELHERVLRMPTQPPSEPLAQTPTTGTQERRKVKRQRKSRLARPTEPIERWATAGEVSPEQVAAGHAALEELMSEIGGDLALAHATGVKRWGEPCVTVTTAAAGGGFETRLMRLPVARRQPDLVALFPRLQQDPPAGMCYVAIVLEEVKGMTLLSLATTNPDVQ